MIFRGVRMEHHISDINIKSFRGIKNLELKNVSGVRCSEEMDRGECHLI